MNERMTQVWQRLIQVLSEPIEAFRALRERPLILWSLVIVVLSELSMNLLSIESDPTGMLGFQEAAPESRPTVVQTILGPLVTIGVFWIGTLIFHYIGKLFGGGGTHRELLSSMGFAAFPGVLQAPTFLLARAISVVSVAAIGQIVFAVWMIVLNVLAIREVQGITTARSVGVFAVGVLASVAVVFMLAVIVGLFALPFSSLG